MRFVLLSVCMFAIGCGGNVVRGLEPDQPDDPAGAAGASSVASSASSGEGAGGQGDATSSTASTAASTGEGGGGGTGGADPECTWSWHNPCCVADEKAFGGSGECDPIMVPGCILGTEKCGDECAIDALCWNGVGDCHAVPNGQNTEMVCAVP